MELSLKRQHLDNVFAAHMTKQQQHERRRKSIQSISVAIENVVRYTYLQALGFLFIHVYFRVDIEKACITWNFVVSNTSTLYAAIYEYKHNVNHGSKSSQCKS